MLATLLPLLSLAVARAATTSGPSPTTSESPASAAPAPAAGVSQLTVSVPLTAPSSAPTLDPALLSFSLEQDRWTDWAGESAPNSFFLNALANLEQRTGMTPVIRIGADSEDHTDFSKTVQVRPMSTLYAF